MSRGAKDCMVRVRDDTIASPAVRKTMGWLKCMNLWYVIAKLRGLVESLGTFKNLNLVTLACNVGQSKAVIKSLEKKDSWNVHESSFLRDFLHRMYIGI